MEQDPKWIKGIFEFEVLQLLTYVLDETGTQQQDTRVVVDLWLLRMNSYFGPEVDTCKNLDLTGHADLLSLVFNRENPILKTLQPSVKPH